MVPIAALATNAKVVDTDYVPKFSVTRRELIETAAEVVEDLGVEKASLREVARRAGISHGGPRHQFPTWNALLAEVAKSLAKDLGDALDLCWYESDDPRTNLVTAAEAYLDFARERPAAFELIHRHDLLEGQGALLRETTGIWIAEVRRNLEKADARHDDAAVLALWSSVHGIAVLAGRNTPSAVMPGKNMSGDALTLAIDRAVSDRGESERADNERAENGETGSSRRVDRVRATAQGSTMEG